MIPIRNFDCMAQKSVAVAKAQWRRAITFLEIAQDEILKFIIHFVVHIIFVTVIIHIFVIVVVHLVFIALLFLLNFVVHFLLGVLLRFKCFFRKRLCFFEAVGHDNIIEKSSSLNLPQFETDMCAAILANLVHVIVILVVRVGDLGVDPLTLVVWVVNHLWLPFTLVFRVVNHGSFPFAIILIIPVIRLGCVGIRKFLGNVVVSVRLDVFRIRNLGFVNPVLRLLGLRILDFLWFQEIEFFLKFSFANRFAIGENFKSVVGRHDESVEVGKIVGFGGNFLLDQEVVLLFMTPEDNVSLFVGTSTDIRSKHDRVFSVSAKTGRVKVLAARKKLEVSTTTVQILFMLDRVLDHKRLVTLMFEFLGQRSREAVKSGVFASLDTLVSFVAIPFSGSVFPLSHFFLWLPFGRFSPSFLPALVVELFLEVNFGCHGAKSGSEDGQSGELHGVWLVRLSKVDEWYN
mmetsp:Transcript_16328/g.44916  ORF Transcript_16328/g.44916 Transcript_16328/m.44916 type:complete len:459 (+) Transcript_16328:126-1502(+)